MKLKHLLLKGIALCGFLAAVDCAQGYSVTNFPGTFVTASSPGAGSGPYSVAAADINGDGKVDLICANDTSSGTLSVLTNNGSGGFASFVTTAVGTFPPSVCGDVSGYVISANLGDNTLTVKRNFSGAFLFPTTLPVGIAPRCVIAADVNGDGQLDLISANSGTNTLTVYTNNGTGTFGFHATLFAGALGVTPVSVCAADVNGDGKMDLISANYFGGSLTVFTNNGTGVLSSNAVYAVGSGPNSVCAADVNGDGKPDLICANENGNTLTVLTNNGHGVFGFSATLGAGSNPASVTAITNANGQVAIICANYNSSSLMVFTNDANGFLGLNATCPAGSGANCVIAVDINKDGWPDLICANYGGNSLTVLTNTRTVSRPLLITAFAPAAGVAGTSVTITGPYNFSTVTNVQFNGQSAAFSINSDTQITAAVPTNASSGYITLLGTGGAVTGTNVFFIPPPGITGFSPASGVAGASVTITGTNLSFVTGVTFNGAPAGYAINSASQITATVPSCAGSGVITVQSAAGTGSSSSNFIFARPAVTLSTATEASLDNAVCNDSNITFSVSGTIGITSTLIVAADTVIDGTGQNITISGNNSVGVFNVKPFVHLTLVNLTVANGLATNGAGIYNNGGTVTVKNCTFTNNVALGASSGNGLGGGICNVYGAVNVTGSTFVSNSAAGGAGAAGPAGASEYAAGGAGGSGGTGAGGAIYNYPNAFFASQLFITNCTFYGNSAAGGNGGAGGNGFNGYEYYNNGFIFVYGGPGGAGGGAGYGYGGDIESFGSVVAVNDTFAGGSASGGAGGVGGNQGNLNQSGIFNYGNGSNGGGLGGNIGEASGTFLFINTIVANPVQGSNFYGGTITDGGNNLSSDATPAFTAASSFTNTNPNLGSLTNNGGPAWTMALLAGSPAIDKGQIIAGLTTDQRGLPRLSGVGVDIGAYELQVVGIDAGLRAYDGAAIIKLACEGPGSLTSALRFSKNGTNYGILLTATNSAYASKFRVQTASGTKALMKLP